MVAWQKNPSHSWWFDSRQTAKRSTWLQSTISELDEKTKKMLKLIEEDADSFRQRAEMYYKKRPELINMVEDYYRAHRSLAERFDQVKSDSRNRLTSPLAKSYEQLKNPFSIKYQSNKEKCYDSYSEISYSETWESEIDEPEQEEHQKVIEETGETEEEECGESDVDDPEEEQVVTNAMIIEDEVMKLREEIGRLKEENRIQKEQLIEKDEEKREVIRQLSLSLEIMKENVIELGKRCKESPMEKTKSSVLEFNKLKGLFSGKLFGWSSHHQTKIVAL